MRLGLIARFVFAIAFTFATAAQAQPDFFKDFLPSTIGPGSVSVATFTINNTAGGAVTSLAFTDDLPASVTIADPASVVSTCALAVGGSISAPVGGSTITLAGGQLPAGQICTISVNVTSSTPGTHTNPAVTLNSSAGSSLSDPASLIVATDRPGFTKNFSPNSLSLGERSTLTLTIDNSANPSGISSIVFTDTFPVGLVVADPSNAVSDCGGDPTFTVGPDFISYGLFGDGSPPAEVLAAGATCTVTVDVVMPPES